MELIWGYPNSPSEFVDFLEQLDRQIDRHLNIHLIMDNYATQLAG